MYVSRLWLHDFRSYADVEVALGPGATAFLGSNGQGKTNLVEAVDYLSRLGSHRVAGDAPLVRAGCDRAVVRAEVVRDGRTATVEVELVPGRANRARVNRSPLPRTRDLAGLVRVVIFSPEDLALVKGDPAERRRFLDDLLVLRSPRLAGVRADYERVLRQRNTLLKSHRAARSSGSREASLDTLGVWDAHLARTGAELWVHRRSLVEALAPYLVKAYALLAQGASREEAHAEYRPSVGADPSTGQGEATAGLDRAGLTETLLTELARRRAEELERGLTLVGPHRDDLLLSLGRGVSPPNGDPVAGGPPDGARLPMRGYASHGESWTFALALRLASYDLLRADGDDPILILDDVFAELDSGRRDRLAHLVAPAEQVLVTAAVPADVPGLLAGARFTVAEGQVRRD